MNISDPYFIFFFLTGIIFIIAGFFLKVKPPKEINSFYGYRTKASMKNIERWKFAQIYSGKKMINSGTYMILFSVVPLLVDINYSNYGIIICVILLLVLCAIPIILTEKAIKHKFQ